MDNSQRPKALVDTRYNGELGIGSNGTNIDATPFAPHSRSSQCNTPAFDGNFSLSGNMSYSNPKLPSTIEMSLRTVFGSSGIEGLNTPQGISLGLEDEVAIADTNNHRCVVVNTNGKYVRQLGSSGTEEGCLYYPRKVINKIFIISNNSFNY